MDFFKKSLLNLSQYFFYVLDFGHEACGILALQPGMEPAPPALEDELLTMDHQGSLFGFHIGSLIEGMEIQGQR